MRFGQTALLAGLSLALAQPALAGGWNEQCDWFENAAIGTRCAQSWSFSTGLSYERYDYSYTASHNGTYDYYNPNFAFAVTPNSWLTLQYTSEYASMDHNWTVGGHTYSSNSSYTSRQVLEANANVIDTGPGAQRYVVNVYGGGAIVPAHDGYDDQTAVFGGLAANGQWRLGSSGFSIVGRATLEIDEWAGVYMNSSSSSDNVLVYPDFRLLLSNDKAGIAAGPVLNSGQWLSTSATGGVGSQSSYYTLGGTIIAQPFRSSPSPLLNGIILQATAVESLGQAGFEPSSIAKTSDVDVSGTVSFHFRY